MRLRRIECAVPRDGAPTQVDAILAYYEVTVGSRSDWSGKAHESMSRQCAILNRIMAIEAMASESYVEVAPSFRHSHVTCAKCEKVLSDVLFVRGE